ncbi:hypothetical protein Pelo_14667 [Pelomyxa schiedti]|nr:hypothetical protein Pelo_14667 [Pelomyxa schiedti]
MSHGRAWLVSTSIDKTCSSGRCKRKTRVWEVHPDYCHNSPRHRLCISCINRTRDVAEGQCPVCEEVERKRSSSGAAVSTRSPKRPRVGRKRGGGAAVDVAEGVGLGGLGVGVGVGEGGDAQQPVPVKRGRGRPRGSGRGRGRGGQAAVATGGRRPQGGVGAAQPGASPLQTQQGSVGAVGSGDEGSYSSSESGVSDVDGRPQRVIQPGSVPPEDTASGDEGNYVGEEDRDDGNTSSGSSGSSSAQSTPSTSIPGSSNSQAEVGADAPRNANAECEGGDSAAAPPNDEPQDNTKPLAPPSSSHARHHRSSAAAAAAAAAAVGNADRASVPDEMEAVVRQPLGSNPLWMTSCWHLVCARCARKVVVRGGCPVCKREVNKLVRTFFVHKAQ